MYPGRPKSSHRALEILGACLIQGDRTFRFSVRTGQQSTGNIACARYVGAKAEPPGCRPHVRHPDLSEAILHHATVRSEPEGSTRNLPGSSQAHEWRPSLPLRKHTSICTQHLSAPHLPDTRAAPRGGHSSRRPRGRLASKRSVVIASSERLLTDTISICAPRRELALRTLSLK